MDKHLDHDYISYLADKWHHYLLKKDPHHPQRKERYEEVLEMVSEMKKETKSGKMLYDFFAQLHSRSEEELEAYNKYREGGSI